MKEISLQEQKKLLIDILKYFDEICRKNNIKYTLVGGSLIGAIRHKGIIPWDDDIDVSLVYEEYIRLVEVLKKEKNSIYEVISIESESSYFYPFIKIVDKRTIIQEIDNKKIENYGVYLDIFSYNNIPKSKIKRNLYYKRIQFYKKLITGYALNNENRKREKNILKKIRNKISLLIGKKNLLKKYIYLCNKYNNEESEYVMLSWPVYGVEHEFLKKEYFCEYIDVNFEDLTVMISKEYDKILTKIFGDYMILPPESKRCSNHSMIAYWK